MILLFIIKVWVGHYKFFKLFKFHSQISGHHRFFITDCNLRMRFRPSYLTTFIFPFVVSRNSPGMKTAHKFILHSSEFSEFLCILDRATHLFVILPIFKLAFSTAIRRVTLGTSRNNYIWQFRPPKRTSI